MALTVASFGEVTSWLSTTTPKTVNTSWLDGDEIVVFGAEADDGDDGLTILTVPTVSGLTFTQAASSYIDSNGQESGSWAWTATAGSDGSGNISVARTGTHVRMYGFGVVVITGAPTGVGVSFGNRTETTTNLTVAAGSIVVYGFGDWNANTTNQTPATGSGTALERADGGDGVNFGWYISTWVGTAAGTFAFGVASYTGTKVGQVAVEITAPAAAAAVGADPLIVGQGAALQRSYTW